MPTIPVAVLPVLHGAVDDRLRKWVRGVVTVLENHPVIGEPMRVESFDGVRKINEALRPRAKNLPDFQNHELGRGLPLQPFLDVLERTLGATRREEVAQARAETR
jgi:hypothetical protein